MINRPYRHLFLTKNTFFTGIAISILSDGDTALSITAERCYADCHLCCESQATPLCYRVIVPPSGHSSIILDRVFYYSRSWSDPETASYESSTTPTGQSTEPNFVPSEPRRRYDRRDTSLTCRSSRPTRCRCLERCHLVSSLDHVVTLFYNHLIECSFTDLIDAFVMYVTVPHLVRLEYFNVRAGLSEQKCMK
jgi:hypothetical protein